MLTIVNVDWPEDPIVTLIDAGFAAKLKSVMYAVSLTARYSVPLLPNIVTVQFPVVDGIVETVRTDFPVPPDVIVTAEGFIVAVGGGPLEFVPGETVAVNEIFPEKRLKVSTEIVELADLPENTGSGFGLAESV